MLERRKDEKKFALSCKECLPGYDGVIMAHRRRGLAHRFIALLTAAAMPLCCCVLNAAAGSSCCSPVEAAQPVAVSSCCSSDLCEADQTEDAPESSPCTDSSCFCCQKAPSTSSNWTPPVDTIGTPLPPFSLQADLVTTAGTGAWNGAGWGDPPPKSLGPDRLRGQVILQV